MIHISAPDGNLSHYQINSQELYETKTVDIDNGIIDISLTRLASGANINIELIGSDFVTNTMFLSATSDQGSSISIDVPSFSGQVEDYAANATELFSESGKLIWEVPPIQEVRNWASGKSIFTESFRIVRTPVYPIGRQNLCTRQKFGSDL